MGPRRARVGALTKAPRASTPTPILHLEGDDAVWSGTDIASWPARRGPTATVASGRTPCQKGATANGHQGVRFRRTEGDQLALGSIQATASDYTVQVVWSAVSRTQSGDRQYFLRSFVSQDTDDIIIPYLANLGTPSGYVCGFFDGAAGSESDPGGGWHHFRQANWRGVNNKIPQRAALHVDTFVLKNGASKLYRDGVLLGTNVEYTQRAMTDATLGGTKGSAPTSTYFDGTCFSLKVWNRALDAGRVASEQARAMARFGLSAWPASTSTPSDIFGANLIALYDVGSPFYAEYNQAEALAAVANKVNTAQYLMTMPASPSCPARDIEGLGGRPSMSFSAGQYSSADALAAAVTGNSGAWTLFAVVKNKAGTGEDSTDGLIAAFGNSGNTVPRHELIMRAGPTPPSSPHVRSLRLDNAGTGNRSALRTAEDPGTTQHLLIGTQDESTDVATIQMDGDSITTSSTSNLGTTTLDTFTMGKRIAGGESTIYAHVAVLGVVNRLITTQERADLRAWAQANYSTP